MSRHSASGGRWVRLRARVLAASDVCWLCGHEGADQVDHVVPIAKGGDKWDIRNMRPAHGTDPCPVCGLRCNQRRNRRPRRVEAGEPRPSRAW